MIETNKDKSDELLRVVKILESLGGGIEKKVDLFKKITGKKKDDFFKYQKVLYGVICDKIDKGENYPPATDIKKEFIKFVVKKYPKLKDSCRCWMKNTGKSRSTFMRTLRKIRASQ